MDEILELIKSDFEAARKILTANENKKVPDYKKEYDGERNQSGRVQVGGRLDKTVGSGDNKKTVVVAKIPFSYQKKIVKTAAAFLFGSPIKLTPNEESESFDFLQKVWDDNRMDNLLKKFCLAVKSETEAAIFFFIKKDESTDNKPVLKARLQTSENGVYYPYFDSYGDMQAFTWDFETTDAAGKKVLNSWVFTAEKTFKYTKESTGWLLEEEDNLFKKIPVVYMSQENPEWWDVKELIDRYEMRFSKFADTNDYFGDPMLLLFGEVTGMPNKEDQGKALLIPQTYADGKLVKGGNAEYLTWEHAPESIKLEMETSDNLIHSLTDTPDLSFNNVKGVGNVSGIALKLMFMGAMIKAKLSEGDYSITIDRILNVLKAGISNVVNTKSKYEDVVIKKEFTSILPDNLQEIIQTLSEATGGKPVISQERAVSLNPMVENAKEEIEAIKKESVQEMGETVVL